ncbi:MAG: CBS domain-containing protein, partial [Thermosynechococcaceae cyanobacterium]
MMKVADIMTTDVVKIKNSARVSDAIKLMRRQGIHTLIVDRTHPQDAYGIVTAFDIVAKVTASGRDSRRVRVYEIMTKPCLVLNPELGVEYAAKLLTTAGIHTAPIIQADLLGILSVSDILKHGD